MSVPRILLSERGSPVRKRPPHTNVAHRHHEQVESKSGRQGDLLTFIICLARIKCHLYASGANTHLPVARSVLHSRLQDVRKPRAALCCLRIRRPYYNRLGSKFMSPNSSYLNYRRRRCSRSSHDRNPRIQHSPPSFSNPPGGNIFTRPRNN